MTSHRLLCRCGALSGEIGQPHLAIRAICYCNDCRAFAFYLDRQRDVLDALGGTDIVPTQARYVTLTSGLQHLACMSLSAKGLLRWYAQCCRTPIANTPRDWRLPYVGLVHSCLEKPLEQSFPNVQMHANARGVKGVPATGVWTPIKALGGFMPRMLLARLNGAYRQTPFFSPAGEPIVPVKVLTAEERERVKSAARSAYT
jgi:hypothetical protein